MAHLCGLCLTLRDLHGQAARLVTNYDGLLVSVLTEAQNPTLAPHRTAGPCALRGFRTADVLDASACGTQLAAAVSLVLAAGKVRDHVVDGDGAFARRLVASAAGLAASRWQAAGARTGAVIGFDTAVLTDAIGRQTELERTTGLGLAEVTEPTETAVSLAFAHTAVLAGQPGNAESLAAAGRHFGRIAHLLDAIEDLAADNDAGAYNPLLATGTTPAQARERCDDALAGLRLAVGELDLQRAALARSLLVHEVDVAVNRTFRQTMREANLGCAPGRSGVIGERAAAGQSNGQDAPGGQPGPDGPGGQPGPGGPGGHDDPSGYAQYAGATRPPRRRQEASCWDCCECPDGCGDCDCGGCDCSGC